MLLVVPDPQGIHGLHIVDVVTSFSILRRNFRNVSATSLIPILRSLPRLQEVRLEPWQQVDQPAQEDVDSGKHIPVPNVSRKRDSGHYEETHANVTCSSTNIHDTQNSPARYPSGQRL